MYLSVENRAIRITLRRNRFSKVTEMIKGNHLDNSKTDADFERCAIYTQNNEQSVTKILFNDMQ